MADIEILERSRKGRGNAGANCKLKEIANNNLDGVDEEIDHGTRMS